MPLVGRFGLMSLMSLIGPGCIIPDRDIRLNQQIDNEHGVRFVDASSVNLNDRCTIESAIGLLSCEDPAVLSPGERAPLPPTSGLPRFMDPLDQRYDFCGCASGERDAKALPPLDDIWVEDRDTVDGVAKDSLYAALLLDMPNDPVADPTLRVAYRNLLNPESPISIDNNIDGIIPNRRRLSLYETVLRRIVISNPNFDSVDLCNDAGQGPGALAEGWHTLTLIVTDRPWTRDEIEVEDGVDAPEVVKTGVPDVAASATWATRHYAFHCSSVENNPDCQCEVPE